MTTDNRTNEPPEAQVEAAAKAIADCHNPGMFERYPEGWRAEARAALVAAQGVVPQAESDARCNCSYPEGHASYCPLRPVQPSSTVDEAALIREAKAEAWDEGYGWRGITTEYRNPYREGSET